MTMFISECFDCYNVHRLFEGYNVVCFDYNVYKFHVYRFWLQYLRVAVFDGYVYY